MEAAVRVGEHAAVGAVLPAEKARISLRAPAVEQPVLGDAGGGVLGDLGSAVPHDAVVGDHVDGEVSGRQDSPPLQPDGVLDREDDDIGDAGGSGLQPHLGRLHEDPAEAPAFSHRLGYQVVKAATSERCLPPFQPG